MTGTITRITERGFGFIRSNESAVDYFFHAASVAEGDHFDNMAEGDTVTFDTVDSPRGPRAENVAHVDVG